jgi:hypothetical protein
MLTEGKHQRSRDAENVQRSLRLPEKCINVEDMSIRLTGQHQYEASVEEHETFARNIRIL